MTNQTDADAADLTDANTTKSKTATFFYGTPKMAADNLPFTKLTCARESVVEEMTYLKSMGYIVTGVNPNNNEGFDLAGNLRSADE